jgi:ribosomal protein S18 acetylase RimI-like enzyme
MRWTIRPYRPEDADWVLAAQVALQEHELSIHDPRLPQTRVPALPATQDYLTMLWDTLARNQGAMLVAQSFDATQLGFVAGSIVEQPWPMETRDSWRFAYVSDIYVEPRMRGTGLAQALIDALAAHFRATDPSLTRLRINVLAANEIARGAYEKAGFIRYEVMYERKL